MRRLALFAAALLVGCATSPPPPAEPLTPAQENRIYGQTLHFAAARMQVEKRGMPRIVVTPSIGTEMQRIHGATEPRFDRLVALYEPTNRTIYVHDWVDLNEIDGQAALVHEMVHFLQDAHDYPFCRYTHEVEAYRVQFRFLSSKGEPVPPLTPEEVAAYFYGTGCD